jgi:hypothetical protein
VLVERRKKEKGWKHAGRARPKRARTTGVQNRGITRKGGHMIMQAADKRAYDSSNQQGVCSTLSRIGPGRPTVLPQTCK